MFYEIYFLVGGFGAFDRVVGVSAGKAEMVTGDNAVSVVK